ncbi:MAG: response regulator transcription factor, partial [Calditrichaeota bacterium]|nr:response regulator transcription factor [Calditrichota bacterium]
INIGRRESLSSIGTDDDVPSESTALVNETEQNKKEKSAPLILIVEDSTDMKSYIRDELRHAYRIVDASNGKQGIALAKKVMPDLIISDIMMPEMDGIELCKQIKGNEITSHIPVILLTARSSEEIKMEGLKTGADDYITKPFNIRTLSVRISNLLESRKKLRERFSKEIKLQPSDITITSIDEKFLQRAIKIVEDNISNEEFDVVMFCKQIGMSRSQLFRKLKALTSQAPNEFIRTIRLKRAAQLLEKSQMTVTEVCYEVGFNYPSHFSQHFRAQFGISPKSYQKKL